MTYRFDRYLIPALPLCFLCLIKNTRFDLALSKSRIVGSLIIAVLYSAFSVTLVADYFRWNEARWGAIDYALEIGVAKEGLWGGYEYFGWNDLIHLWFQKKQHSFKYWVQPALLPESEIVKKFSYSYF